MSKKQRCRLSFKEICTIKHALQLQIQAKRIRLAAAPNSEDATRLRQDLEFEAKLSSFFADWEDEIRHKYDIPKITDAEARDLMRHDAYVRERGGLRQIRHDR